MTRTASQERARLLTAAICGVVITAAVVLMVLGAIAGGATW